MSANDLTIQILYFRGCPNHERTAELAREVAQDVGVEIDVEEIEITTPEEAAQLRFLGSPSVRVNGIDIEPSTRSSTTYALACRTYDGEGMPHRELLVAALRDAGVSSRGENR